MSICRNHRQRRRSRKLYRKPRFDNRVSPEGWLPPSVWAKKEAIYRLLKDIGRYCHYSEITLEDVQVDVQRLKNPEISGVDYENGFRKDYHNLRYAVLHRDNYTCELCGESDKQLEVRHIVPRKHGGTNQPKNLITLCKDCHNAVHAGKVAPPKPVKKALNLRYSARNAGEELPSSPA